MAELLNPSKINDNEKFRYLSIAVKEKNILSKEEFALFASLPSHQRSSVFMNACFSENINIAKQMIIKIDNDKSVIEKLLPELLIEHTQKSNETTQWLLSYQPTINLDKKYLDIFKKQNEIIWNTIFSFYPLNYKRIYESFNRIISLGNQNALTWMLKNQSSKNLHYESGMYYFALNQAYRYNNKFGKEIMYEFINSQKDDFNKYQALNLKPNFYYANTFYNVFSFSNTSEFSFYFQTLEKTILKEKLEIELTSETKNHKRLKI